MDPINNSTPKRQWIYLVVAIILISLLLIAWQGGFLTTSTNDELSPEEVKAISDFLNSEEIPVPTEAEVKAISEYLNSAEAEVTVEEQNNILEYLNQ